MDVVDVFCGIGGFSCGAIRAGCRPILGVDREDTVLHVHLSPPCTTLSHARRGAGADAVADGLDCMRAALDLVISRSYESWSLENVPSAAVRKLVDEYVTAHPGLVASAVLDAADYGTPSSRLRLFAGPPGLIKRLREVPVMRVSVATAFERAGIDLHGALQKECP